MAQIMKSVKRLLPKQAKQQLRLFPPVYHIRNAACRWKYAKTTHDDIYDSAYFEMVEETTGASVEVIADSILDKFSPASVIDVGCGTGALLERLSSSGVRPFGIEYADAALEFCRRRRLPVRQLDLNDREATDSIDEPFDVAVSMEVGQQLSASSADSYVDLLCRVAPLVVFSSDTPGGFDRLPLNEQRADYWIEKFIQRGFHVDEPTTDEFRSKWKSAETASWFCEHVIVFRADRDQTVNLRSAEEVAPAEANTAGQKESHCWSPSPSTTRTALDMATDAVLFVEPAQGRVVHVNATACAKLGYSREELLNLRLDDLVVDTPGGGLRARSSQANDDNGLTVRDVSILERKDGSRFPVELDVRHSDSDGRAIEIVLAHDVSDRRRLEELWHKDTYCDALTGLPNRDVFESRLGDAMERVCPAESPFALFFIDLNEFKQVNDTRGHLAGDKVLRAVARRIAACTRPGDTITRYGGDEFLLLVDQVSDHRQLIDIARRLSRVIPLPVAMAGTEVIVTASIGIACSAATRCETVEELLQRADRAMYRAKASSSEECWVIDEPERESASVLYDRIAN